MSVPASARLAQEVPAARQGPGPMPASVIDALAPALNRLVARTMPGANRAGGVGLGTELAQLRPYEVGDDVRHLDAAASARTGAPHVRLHVPERALSTWIVLDLSPSMAFGTQDRLKADVAEGVALVLGRLGVRQAGSVGVIACGAGPVGPGTAAPVEARGAGPVGPGTAAAGTARASAAHGDAALAILPPRGAKAGLVGLGRLLSAGVAPDGHHAPDALATALGRVLRLAGQAGLVAVISDFRDQRGWTRPLGALALRHSVLAVEIADPRESELPAVGAMTVIDPESGRLLRVDTQSRSLRERFARIEADRRAEVHRELRRLRAHHVRLSTDGSWLRALARGLA